MNFRRQLGFFNPEEFKQPRITVIGAGGIGSFVVPSLAKMGMTDITVYDDDMVDDHNLPNQNFETEQIGELKVNALKSNVYDATGVTINAIDKRLTTRDRPLNTDICIFAVDDIEVRSSLFNRFMAVNNRPKYVIDGRLGGEMFMVYTVDTSNADAVDLYRSTFFPKEEAMELPCTAKAIIYIGYEITSHIVRQVKLITTGGEFPYSVFVDHANGVYDINDNFMMYR